MATTKDTKKNSPSSMVKDLDTVSQIPPARSSERPAVNLTTESKDKKPRQPYYMVSLERAEAVNGILKREYSDIAFIETDKIRIPDDRDRMQSSITKENCQDLIDTIATQGQMTPGVVRPVTDNGDGKLFELVVGARRLFACAHLKQPFRATIAEDMSDFQVRVAQDIENAARKDISPYERGRFYKRWLAQDFDNNTSHMSEVVKTFSRPHLLRLVSFGGAPDFIVRKCININDETERSYREIKPLIFDGETLRSDIEEKLSGFPDHSMTLSEIGLFLKDALKPKQRTRRTKPITIETSDKKTTFKITMNGNDNSANINMPKEVLTLPEDEFIKRLRLIWINLNT